jgi:dipeptidase D
MSALSDLDPKQVWTYFGEICNIPRLSKNEGKIRQFLICFAMTNKLSSLQDETGNILIIKPADKGFEDYPPIVLQSHLDMVGEKNPDSIHNWETDPIKPVIKGDWVAASGTTLGADDGIGIATQMAILTDKSIKTGKIECLFTIDEESGMTGANNLKPGFFNGKTLINLDSEDEGILFIGCAGSIETVGTMRYKSIPVKQTDCAADIFISGLHGGHSGDEIHKNYANSIKLMARLLNYIKENSEYSIADFNGGNLRNAIPRESYVTIVFKKSQEEVIKNDVRSFFIILTQEIGALEKEINITVKEARLPQSVFDHNSQKQLLAAIDKCPHGVISWSKDMDNLVETSTNLASVKLTENNTIQIVTTQRSSSEDAKHKIANTVKVCLKDSGSEVAYYNEYPGWKPNINSAILKLTKNTYIDLFGKEPQVKAIHAGLECGIIYEKYKDIDMISFGPTIRGAHTTEEMIEIKTVAMFWELLVNIFKTPREPAL